MTLCDLINEANIDGPVSIRIINDNNESIDEIYIGFIPGIPAKIRKMARRMDISYMYAIEDYIDNVPAAVLVFELRSRN